MAVQKKQGVIPPSQGPLSARTTDSRRVGNRSERTRENVKPDLQTKKISSPVLKHNQICNSIFSRTTPAGNGLNVDERLKAARERREEHQRLLASRERSRLEREQQAKRYHEQQLQERRKKLLEQRLKEERRRAAVEEKRKQRLREEKERHESAVRKTLERSHKVQQQLNQNSRGRKLTKTVPRGLPLTTWEKNLVSRLLTPTCSYLARSKSARCQTGEDFNIWTGFLSEESSCAVSYYSMNTPTPTITHKHQPGSVNHRPPASSSSNTSQHTSISPAQTKVARQQDSVKKTSNSGSGTKLSAENVKQATSTQIRTTSTSPERSPQRSVSRHLTPLQLELSSVPEEDTDVCASDGNTRPVRGPERGQWEKLRPENSPETPCSSLSGTKTEDWTGTSTDGTGSSDLEKASRLLAEKRREARLQREKEKQERLQREEAERRSNEEGEYRRAEEQAEQEAEAQRLIEEKRRREEEEQRRAEEERAQAMKEAALLLKQREEELAKERAQAEQMKKERETAAQKEEAERQARKKRLEEIMRRTRRTDSPDTKSVAARVLPNEALPKENTAPVHNGTIADGVKLLAGAKTTQLVLNNEPDVVPVVAFKDRRSMRALSGLEDIQTQQRAEVI